MTTTDLASRPSGAPSSAPGGRRRRPGTVQPFDFRRPSTLGRDQARALRIVHETFARQFATILSTTLRSVSSVAVAEVDQVSYDEYVRSSPELSFLALLQLEPLPGAGVLQVPLDIAMAIIDRLLGGSGEGTQPSRALTDIESSLLRGVVQRILRELDYALESLVRTTTTIVQLESNPQFAQIAAPSDMVVVATYDVRIGSHASTASLCIPFTSLQPALEQVTGTSLFADRRAFDPVETGRAVAKRLTDVPVDVAVRFDPVLLTSAQILDLQVGDVLPLRHPVSTPLSVVAADSRCAAAVPGSSGRRLAFLVVQDPVQDPVVQEPTPEDPRT